MTQKASGAGATATKTETSLVPFDPKSVKQAAAPPETYKRCDTGAEVFWRGDIGDVLHGILIGPAHEGLAGERYIGSPPVPNPAFPKVVTLQLLSPTVGGAKLEEKDKEKTWRECKSGELVYANVNFRAREVLTMEAGTRVWLKVLEEKDIGKGQTLKIFDARYEAPVAAAKAAALEPGQTAPLLPSLFARPHP